MSKAAFIVLLCFVHMIHMQFTVNDNTIDLVNDDPKC